MIDALVESLLYHPQDAPRTPDGELTTYFTPWPTQGIETVKNNVTTFFSALAEHHGRADWIVMDNENYISSWSLSRDHLLAIQNDPRSVELQQRLGFDNFPSIYSYRKNSNYITWNAVLHEMIVNDINKAAFEPVRMLFPDVKGANYKSYILTPEEVVPDPNGHPQYYRAHVGTHNSTSFYGRFGGLRDVQLDGTDVYGDAPFAVLRWNLNFLRAIRRSSDVPMTPWISHKMFIKNRFRDNPYYEEMIYHLVLTGIDDLFYWNPHRPPNDAHATRDDYADDSQDHHRGKLPSRG